MYRSYKMLLIFALILTGCKETETVNIIPEIPTSSSSIPVIKTRTTICVESNSLINKYWPIEANVDKWNKNGKNLLRFESNFCDGQVFIAEKVLPELLGRLNFFQRGLIVMELNPKTPIKWRNSVVCHEFGHVLGLSHSLDEESCMNIDVFSVVPTGEDLGQVGKYLWKWESARKNSCEC